MIECRKSTAQNYECCVIAKDINNKSVSFDACLARELFFLWDNGIETTGSCCGCHSNCNSKKSFININQENKEMLNKMIYNLKYEYIINKFGAYEFKPKTKLGGG